jgi:hypothetical protein
MPRQPLSLTSVQVRALSPAVCKNRRLSLRWFEPNTCHVQPKRPLGCVNAARRAVFFLSRDVSGCHCGSMRDSGYGRIADSVRAKLAMHITARLADLRPECVMETGRAYRS